MCYMADRKKVTAHRLLATLSVISLSLFLYGADTARIATGRLYSKNPPGWSGNATAGVPAPRQNAAPADAVKEKAESHDYDTVQILLGILGLVVAFSSLAVPFLIRNLVKDVQAELEKADKNIGEKLKEMRGRTDSLIKETRLLAEGQINSVKNLEGTYKSKLEQVVANIGEQKNAAEDLLETYKGEYQKRLDTLAEQDEQVSQLYQRVKDAQRDIDLIRKDMRSKTGGLDVDELRESSKTAAKLLEELRAKASLNEDEKILETGLSLYKGGTLAAAAGALQGLVDKPAAQLISRYESAMRHYLGTSLLQMYMKGEGTLDLVRQAQQHLAWVESSKYPRIDSYANHASCLLELGKYPEALQCIQTGMAKLSEEAFDSDPFDGRIYMHLGNCFFYNENTEEARLNYNKWLRISEGSNKKADLINAMLSIAETHLGDLSAPVQFTSWLTDCGPKMLETSEDDGKWLACMHQLHDLLHSGVSVPEKMATVTGLPDDAAAYSDWKPMLFCLRKHVAPGLYLALCARLYKAPMPI